MKLDISPSTIWKLVDLHNKFRSLASGNGEIPEDSLCFYEHRQDELELIMGFLENPDKSLENFENFLQFRNAKEAEKH